MKHGTREITKEQDLSLGLARHGNLPKGHRHVKTGVEGPIMLAARIGKRFVGQELQSKCRAIRVYLLQGEHESFSRLRLDLLVHILLRKVLVGMSDDQEGNRGDDGKPQRSSHG